MEKPITKIGIIFRIVLAVILFSLFIKFDSILQIADLLVDSGWSLPPILLVITLIRMALAGLVTIVVVALVLEFKRIRDWLPAYLRIDSKIVLAGFLSFVLFCALAAGLSLAMGIFVGDMSTVFSTPDLGPDPDVVGWGFFLLALVPGIWEELAYRGLIQSRLREVFSTRLSIILSSAFFALFHFSNLVFQPLASVVPGVVMAFCFGLGWGWLTVRSRSVVPAMLSHYLIDSFGQIFLGVDTTNLALSSAFFLLLTLSYPVLVILLSRTLYREPVQGILQENLKAA
jgi:membrane protease YdiL (CAAX protease family)